MPDIFNSQFTSEQIENKLNNLQTEDGIEFRFGKTSDGKYGYIIRDEETGADTVIPFKDTNLQYSSLKIADCKEIKPKFLYTEDDLIFDNEYEYLKYKAKEVQVIPVSKSLKHFNILDCTEIEMEEVFI